MPMKLEEEIKQDVFESEHQKAFLNILVTSGWLNGLNSAALKPFGISPQQYNVLRILRGQHPHPVTLSVIQERMLDKMSNASRLVDKLVEKKLVDRNQCCHNRRQVDILITPSGLELLLKSESPMKDAHRQLEQITDEEAIDLSRILEKIRG
jgi:DNA-binding MarR family transcriptional regulator